MKVSGQVDDYSRGKVLCGGPRARKMLPIKKLCIICLLLITVTSNTPDDDETQLVSDCNFDMRKHEKSKTGTTINNATILIDIEGKAEYSIDSQFVI